MSEPINFERARIERERLRLGAEIQQLATDLAAFNGTTLEHELELLKQDIRAALESEVEDV